MNISVFALKISSILLQYFQSYQGNSKASNSLQGRITLKQGKYITPPCIFLVNKTTNAFTVTEVELKQLDRRVTTD